MKTRLRLKMRLKLFSNGKLILATTRHRKTQIRAILERVSHQSAYLYVEYVPGFWNDSFHKTDESLIKALNYYTEKALVSLFTQKKGAQ